MRRILVAGIGTGVGKTVVSAIMTTLLRGDYWKPVESGMDEGSDSATMEKWIDESKHRIFSPAYSLKAPLSPHEAARLENIAIQADQISLPQTARPLIIESAGGIFTPLSTALLNLDLFKNWDCQWIIVSKHYLGSINHTLLTLDTLTRHGIPLAGLIFNGAPNPATEEIILKIAKRPLLARLLPEKTINKSIISRYASQWKIPS